MVCPRCGRRPPDDTASPFCPYCGRFLTATRWVAVPPAGIRSSVDQPPPASLPRSTAVRPDPALGLPAAAVAGDARRADVRQGSAWAPGTRRPRPRLGADARRQPRPAAVGDRAARSDQRGRGDLAVRVAAPQPPRGVAGRHRLRLGRVGPVFRRGVPGRRGRCGCAAGALVDPGHPRRRRAQRGAAVPVRSDDRGGLAGAGGESLGPRVAAGRDRARRAGQAGVRSTSAVPARADLVGAVGRRHRAGHDHAAVGAARRGTGQGGRGAAARTRRLASGGDRDRHCAGGHAAQRAADTHPAAATDPAGEGAAGSQGRGRARGRARVPARAEAAPTQPEPEAAEAGVSPSPTAPAAPG